MFQVISLKVNKETIMRLFIAMILVIGLVGLIVSICFAGFPMTYQVDKDSSRISDWGYVDTSNVNLNEKIVVVCSDGEMPPENLKDYIYQDGKPVYSPEVKPVVKSLEERVLELEGKVLALEKAKVTP